MSAEPSHADKLRAAGYAKLWRLALLIYGGPTVAVGAALSLEGALTRPELPTALALGHLLGLVIGGSWVFGALYGANRSFNHTLGATLLLSPIRYIGGIVAILSAQLWLGDARLVGTLVLTFMLTQVCNHVLQTYVSVKLAKLSAL